MEKQTELGVGLSKVLTAMAKWSNELSECFSLEKRFFTCFITLTLQSFLFTDCWSREFISATCKHILQGYRRDLTLYLKVWTTFQPSLSRFFYDRTQITHSPSDPPLAVHRKIQQPFILKLCSVKLLKIFFNRTGGIQ